MVFNLINNAMIQGQPKRKAFAKKYGINPPNHLVFSPTMKCNLKCYGCYWNDGNLVNGCMAGGKNYLHINVKGDVEPCVFVHFAADNIKDKSLAEIITSPFFMAFRKRQPFNENHLRPCSIIDNPYVLREIVAETKAYSTHSGAEGVVTDLAKQLDAYSCEYGLIADKVWEEEYKQRVQKEEAV